MAEDTAGTPDEDAIKSKVIRSGIRPSVLSAEMRLLIMARTSSDAVLHSIASGSITLSDNWSYVFIYSSVIRISVHADTAAVLNVDTTVRFISVNDHLDVDSSVTPGHYNIETHIQATCKRILTCASDLDCLFQLFPPCLMSLCQPLHSFTLWVPLQGLPSDAGDQFLECEANPPPFFFCVPSAHSLPEIFWPVDPQYPPHTAVNKSLSF